MAKYTVELGDVVKSGLKVFDFDYTFYDATKKPDFEQKFINHFYFREIGQETVGRFQHYLKCKLDERLPYYNEILKLAQLEFDILNPYSVTETLQKTETLEKTDAKTTTSNATQTGSTNRTANATSTGNKTNTLESETEHTETVDFSKDETINETGTLDNDNTTDIYNKKVGSDTPNGLLSMEDIKNNVYASKADIEDSSTATTDKQSTTADKTGKSTESTSRTTKDVVDATSHDTSTDITNETSNEGVTNTATGTGTESGTGTETGSENYTLHRVGHIGVQTKSELLAKQIELLQQMQTVLTQFFDECEDLFMQIY